MGVLRASAILCVGVVALSAAISGAGKWLGHTIALGGHSDDQTVHEIVIGNDVVAVPANAIRFEKDRHSGTAERLDVYLSWPDLEGYSKEKSDLFNHTGKDGSLIFLTFEPRMMSRDMSGRFEPIYRQLIEQPGLPGPGDTTLYKFTAKSGYMDEELAVAGRTGQTPFVARCLTDDESRQSLAQCQRDVLLTDGLSLSYRFPKTLLANWQAMESAVLERARFMLKTGAPASINGS
ncbi:hypothetical protein DY251_17880 [Mesorhizobium denitrificans]|uniref:Uncharacterized protein n=2 Tax=Phyllobacteriaceae TaxID=69277 RepID=A0A371X6I7_9HYPH|nr:hypothetical protein DY251_17880 [Mesorhizobium denitrificans]